MPSGNDPLVRARHLIVDAGEVLTDEGESHTPRHVHKHEHYQLRDSTGFPKEITVGRTSKCEEARYGDHVTETVARSLSFVAGTVEAFTVKDEERPAFLR